ncbi:hypothetical protein Tco_1493969 [Tanacetum coccineum]
MVNATKDNFDEDDLVKFQELLLDAAKPLYEGCPDFIKLFAIFKLLKLKGMYGCSDKFFTELLRLLKKILPAGNEMDDKDLTACQTCRISRWKVDNKTHKVYKNIPAKAWRTIDETFPKIAEDLRNLRLGISDDGVDVNIGNRHHIVWPVLTVIYNLPPWYWRHHYVPHCIDFMHVEKNVAESLVGTLLNVPRKTKDGVYARLDLAELGVKPELFAMQEEDKTTLPSAGHVQNRNRPEGCIAEEIIVEETIEFFSEYHKSMETIGIPPDKHETDKNKEGKPLSAGKSSEVYAKLFQKAHFYVIRNTDELVLYIDSDDSNGLSISKVPIYGSSVQGLLDYYGYDNIEDCLSNFYFPSTDKEDTIVHTRCVLGLPNVDTWDDILKKHRMRTPGRCADKWMNSKDYGKDNHHVFYSSDDTKGISSKGPSITSIPIDGPSIARLSKEPIQKELLAWYGYNIVKDYLPVAKKPIPKFIFKRPIPIKGLANVETWDNIVKKFGMRTPGRRVDKSKGKIKVRC